MDLTACDREPIHIPGSIQPHGALVAADASEMTVRSVSSNIGTFTLLPAVECLGRQLGDVLGPALRDGIDGRPHPLPIYFDDVDTPAGIRCDIVVHRAGDLLLVELEPVPAAAMTSAASLDRVQRAVGHFENSGSLQALCDVAVQEVRHVTGFDRVMVYRFLDDASGRVVAEAKADAFPSFLNHHFPASDIPKQARDLYIRNRIRLIPDSGYVPAAMLGTDADADPLDMSDCAWRSVSPIHLQYLRNMGVAASMSISIVRDGALWGLIACHHSEPLFLPPAIRSVCSLLGSVLSDQIAAKVEAEGLARRIRLRDDQDRFLRTLMRAPSIDEALTERCRELVGILPSDGIAVAQGDAIATAGVTPPSHELPALFAWLKEKADDDDGWCTETLSRHYAPAERFAAAASGLLGVVVSEDDPLVLAWFRAEQVETVKWAGNPHKPADADATGALTPRKSFELWEETVRGRSRAWDAAEVEAARHLRDALADLRQRQRVRDLNTELALALAEKDSLVKQKDLLLREVNHRVQNTLQLVRSLFHLQASATLEPAVKTQLEEAGRRLAAIGLVHRRLYRTDEIETVEFDRYLGELQDELVQSLGAEWREHIHVDAAPLSVPTDRVVTLALMTTELVINAVKYAYDGAVGPIEISVREASASTIEIVVADRGRGMDEASTGGFGSRLIHALAGQLKGEIRFSDNGPGTRAVATVPRA